MPQIEYFYSAHSAFAYIGSARLMDIARASGREIKHRPIDLRPVMQSARGAGFSGFSNAHRDYFFGREIERWSEYRNVPIVPYRPSHHDNSLALASGMIIAATEGNINADNLAHLILEAHWRDDADHADPKTLAEIASSAGYDATQLLDRALEENIQAKFRANTAEAIRRSVFGSPTYFVDGDMYYGQDHLELLERALQRPFGGHWPRHNEQ
ncbi:MAG: 2-hydroxychromene-2-carboxylate isomerase [Hyphomicrobiaceae bacterium]